MKKTAIGLSLAAALVAAASPVAARETEGNWMVRLRAVHLGMDESSTAGNGNAGIDATVLPANALAVSNELIPEVDISYFFAKNWAAELILTTPQKHRVSATSGPLAGDLGTFRHLPPTLTVQYHFLPTGTFRPYVGLGVNYTRISSVNLSNGLGLDKSSVGGAWQVGADYKLQKNLYLNVDVKKIYINSGVSANGINVSELNLDPLAIGVGLGWRF